MLHTSSEITSLELAADMNPSVRIRGALKKSNLTNLGRIQFQRPVSAAKESRKKTATH